MIQELVRIGPISISPFGLSMVLAFLAAYWQLGRSMRQHGLGSADDAGAILFAAGAGGLVGAKLYYAALYRDWGLLLERWGFVWYGGFALGAAAVLFVARRRGLFSWRLIDATVPAMALGYGVGRVGCFLVGDDYGVPTDLPWGVRFPVGLPPSQAGWLRSEFGVEIPESVPDAELLAVHPTQLYEAALAIVIWRVAVAGSTRARAAGVTGLVALALLAAERFAVEFLRAKDDRFLGPLTVAQGVSLALLAVCLVLIGRRRASPEAG